MSHAWLVFVCSIISFAANIQYGFSSVYLNTPVDEFKDYLDESLRRMGHKMTDATYDWMWNLILNVWFIGFFVGIWLSPLLNDRFGRKVGFLAGNALSLLSACLRFISILCYLPWLLFIARLLGSIAMAVVYQSCILYLQEISPTHLRGFSSFISEISFAVMCIVGTVVGTDQLLGHHLPWLVFCPIVPTAVLFCVQIFLPETPKFLLVVQQDKEATIRSIRFYHGKSANVDDVMAEISLEASGESDAASSFSSLLELFTVPHLRKATLLSCAALQNTCALWCIILSSTYFLEQAGVSPEIAKWSSTGMMVSYTIGTLVGAALIEKLGRRPLHLAFCTANFTVLSVFVICDRLAPHVPFLRWGCTACMLLYGFTYGAGIGPIAWFISSELAPQKYRSLIQSLGYAINTIAVVALTFSTLPLYGVIGSYSFIPLYIIPAALCTLYLFFQLPETKGREIHEIVTYLQGHNRVADVEK